MYHLRRGLRLATNILLGIPAAILYSLVVAVFTCPHLLYCNLWNTFNGDNGKSGFFWEYM